MSGPALAAVLLAGVAGACLASTSAARLRRLRPGRVGVVSAGGDGAGAGRSEAAGAGSGRWPGRPAGLLLVGGGLVAGLVVGAAAGSATGGLVAAAATGAVVQGALSRRRRLEAARGRAVVVELAQAVSAELRSGASARASLAAAAVGLPGCERLAATARAPHGDVPAALHAAAGLPGAEGLRSLEACWRVCERTGSGLAGPVARLVESLRDDEQVRREVAAELAGPRATCALLALLPVLGVVMGTALGARPLRTLLGTPLGSACLLAGLVLEGLGVLWTAWIIRRAEPP